MASSGRHLARRNAVQALYQWDMTGQAADRIKPDFIHDERLKGRYQEYFNRLIKEIPIYCDQVDKVIETHADRPISKLDPLEKAVLRVGAYELLFQVEVPPSVVVNEAIEIAKLFCSDHGYRYVNGVLDKVLKAQQKESA